MTITIRPAAPADAPACGCILHTAFVTLADQHNFPRHFTSVEAATLPTSAHRSLALDRSPSIQSCRIKGSAKGSCMR